MPTPTIEDRLKKRCILMSTDSAFIDEVERLLPDGWTLQKTNNLDQLGEWNDLLLYRFLILDLDEVDVYDPLDVIYRIRMEYQINLPVFCFGGDDATRDEMRLSRADRFFDKEQLTQVLPAFFEQYNW